MVGKITKQAYEEIDCSVDFALDLGTAETLSTCTVTAINMATGADATSAVIATSPAPAISGTLVQFRVKCGADGDRYKVTVKTVTSAGQKIEADVKLNIKDE